MDPVPAENRELKEALKQALVEILQERPELFSNIFAEALEDIALARAIHAGEASGAVSRAEVMKLLEHAR